MASIEEKINLLLTQHHIGEITEELCDFSIKEQNAAVEAQGGRPTAPSDFMPKLGKTVTYVVACIIFNERDEVLMVEEAKATCAGKWYLPAGRMEVGESIIDAAVREVYEESCLNVQLTTLLAIETAGGSWIRFVFTGNVTGGKIKTPADADAESIQARWIGSLSSVPLRANDILPVIEIARSRRAFLKSTQTQYWHKDLLPVRFRHEKSYIRVLAVIRKRATNSLNILVSEKNVHHFPTVELHPNRSIHSTLKKFMIELFGAELPQHRPHGIISIEHNSNKILRGDGVCINLLVVFRPPLEAVSVIGKCIWHQLGTKEDNEISLLLSSKTSTLPLNVIR